MVMVMVRVLLTSAVSSSGMWFLSVERGVYEWGGGVFCVPFAALDDPFWV